MLQVIQCSNIKIQSPCFHCLFLLNANRITWLICKMYCSSRSRWSERYLPCQKAVIKWSLKSGLDVAWPINSKLIYGIFDRAIPCRWHGEGSWPGGTPLCYSWSKPATGGAPDPNPETPANLPAKPSRRRVSRRPSRRRRRSPTTSRQTGTASATPSAEGWMRKYRVN